MIAQDRDLFFTDDDTLNITYEVDPDSILTHNQDVNVVIPIKLQYIGKNAAETVSSDVMTITEVIQFNVNVPGLLTNIPCFELPVHCNFGRF